MGLLYPAGKNVWDCVFSIKIPAEFLVHPSEKFGACGSPRILEILEVFESEGANPLVKVLGLGNVTVDIFPCL